MDESLKTIYLHANFATMLKHLWNFMINLTHEHVCRIPARVFKEKIENYETPLHFTVSTE
jgi:hypothetical protein